MFEKLLNKIGLYTEKQYKTIAEDYLFYKSLHERLKSDYRNAVAALRICEDEKRAVTAENVDLRRSLENRKMQIDLMLKDFDEFEKEKENFKKELKKVKLKLARSVKRRKR